MNSNDYSSATRSMADSILEAQRQQFAHDEKFHADIARLPTAGYVSEFIRSGAFSPSKSHQSLRTHRALDPS